MSLSSHEIIQAGLRLGFDDVGLCAAHIPAIDIEAWRAWLDQGYHGDLQYMEQDLRSTPSKLLDGAKTAIVFVTFYKQPDLPYPDPGKGLVASYARGKDYHHLHRKRLKKFVLWLQSNTESTIKSRGFSDSAPLLEKALAVQAGLGWFGKNTLLIHRKFGTYTLLSVCLTTLEVPLLSTGSLRLPKCGSCRRCIDACPTKALHDYVLDARRCLSYHTIESKKIIPDEIAKANPGFIFGCDICQQVCPHNIRTALSDEQYFAPSQGLGAYLSHEELVNMPDSQLWGTPLQRRKREGLLYTLATLPAPSKNQ